MDDIFQQLKGFGIVPVVKIENADDAPLLGKALLDGGLPVAEITFRTDAAEQAIRSLSRSHPDLLVGAGTVLSVEYAMKAITAGAKFIVSPGFNPKVVDYCLQKHIPVVPGINSPTQVERAMEKGLKVLKFFPAEASGGLKTLKAMTSVYGDIEFIPTGGINNSNLAVYLSLEKVLACGGTWIAKSEDISQGRFEDIKRLAQEAVQTALGFELAHVGVNASDQNQAHGWAVQFAQLLALPIQEGSSSILAGTAIEIMKKPYLGRNGHLAIATNRIDIALSFFRRKGVKVKEGSAKVKNGRLVAIYLEEEIAGFAIHLLQK